MPGLLDILNSDQGRTALGLLAAAGPSAVPQSFGQRLMGGLLQAQAMGQQQEDREAQKRMREMQLQQHQMMLAQAQRQAQLQKQQDAFRQSIPSPQFQAGLDVLAANGGVTQAGSVKVPKVDPNTDLLYGAMQAGLIDPVQYLTATRKDNAPKYMNVAPGGTVFDERAGRAIYTAPKDEAADPFVRLLKQSGIDPASPQGQRLLQQRLQKEATHQPGTNLTVNAGPKAFETDLGKLGVSILEKGRESAQASAGVLESIGQNRQAAAAGAYQGAGADLKLGAAKALGALGMPYDAKTVANSELFSAQANTFVLNSIKQLGANPSNADREFIEKTVPRLQTDPAALPALLDFLDAKARRQIGAYNQQARQTQKSSPFLPFSLEVQEPQATGGWSIKPKGQ